MLLLNEDGKETDLQKVSEPGNVVPRKFSSLPENFSMKVFSHKEKMIFTIFGKRRKMFLLFFTADHKPR